MFRMFRPFVLGLLVIICLRAQSTISTSLKPYSDFSRLPFYFEQNRGQASRETLYLGRGGRLIASLTKKGATLDLNGHGV